MAVQLMIILIITNLSYQNQTKFDLKNEQFSEHNVRENKNKNSVAW